MELLTPELINAWRYYMRGANWSGKGSAARFLEKARADVAQGVNRYPAPVRQTCRASESDGLRYIGRVLPDQGYNNFWDTRGDCGWHTDPFGDVFKDGYGLCFGVVYQLPGRNGESRFVAGYEFGGCDGGPTLDLSRIFTEPPCNWQYDACDLKAARDAGRHADSLAKAAAESEREYQTAWQAGNQWASLADEVKAARADALAILKERRALKGQAGFPALCGAIRSQLLTILGNIRAARESMAELAKGDGESLYFWPGDERLQTAFCEAAGLSTYPGAKA